MNPESVTTISYAVESERTASYQSTEKGYSELQESTFDSRTIAFVRNLVYALVRAPHLRQEREDCVQEALCRFWEVLRRNPGEPPSSYLSYCRFFIRDSLKHGRSLDSPKRRQSGSLFETAEIPNSILSVAPDADPWQEVYAHDDEMQIDARLNATDRSILKLLLEGNTTREVAQRLRISPSGVGKGKLRIKSVATQIGLCARSRRPKQVDLQNK